LRQGPGWTYHELLFWSEDYTTLKVARERHPKWHSDVDMGAVSATMIEQLVRADYWQEIGVYVF